MIIIVNFCVFCSIIKGDEPAYILVENDITIAFLAKPSITEGHLLVIPKRHKVGVFELDEEELGDILSVSKLMAELLKTKLGASGVNLLNASGKDAQQSVFHFHMHVVPRFQNDGMDLWYGKFDRKQVNLEDGYAKLTV